MKLNHIIKSEQQHLTCCLCFWQRTVREDCCPTSTALPLSGSGFL